MRFGTRILLMFGEAWGGMVVWLRERATAFRRWSYIRFAFPVLLLRRCGCFCCVVVCGKLTKALLFQ